MEDFFNEIGHLFFVSFLEHSPFGIKTRNIRKLPVLYRIRWSLLLPIEYPKPLLTPSVQHLLKRHQIDQAGKVYTGQALLGVEDVQITVASCSDKGLLRRNLVIDRSADFILHWRH